MKGLILAITLVGVVAPTNATASGMPSILDSWVCTKQGRRSPSVIVATLDTTATANGAYLSIDDPDKNQLATYEHRDTGHLWILDIALNDQGELDPVEMFRIQEGVGRHYYFRRSVQPIMVYKCRKVSP